MEKIPNYVDSKMAIGRKLEIFGINGEGKIGFVTAINIEEKWLERYETFACEDDPAEDLKKNGAFGKVISPAYPEINRRFKLAEGGKRLNPIREVRSYDVVDKETGEILAEVRV